MRRLLILVLAWVLPLQFAWAGVAIYCQHESGLAAQHFGHHEHQHHGAKADSAKVAKMQVPGADADCQVCQFGAAQSVPAGDQLFVAPHGSATPPESPASFRSHVPSGLERPSRTLAV